MKSMIPLYTNVNVAIDIKAVIKMNDMQAHLATVVVNKGLLS